MYDAKKKKDFTSSIQDLYESGIIMGGELL
jgi:hypothetical protein